jgi:hypothetical protein
MEASESNDSNENQNLAPPSKRAHPVFQTAYPVQLSLIEIMRCQQPRPTYSPSRALLALLDGPFCRFPVPWRQ